MRRLVRALLFAVWVANYAPARAQDVKAIVQQAVRTELAADDADHSRWLYLDIDRKPGSNVRQWVAETGQGDITRVLDQNGRPCSDQEQRSQMESFVRNAGAQARQRAGGQHDDRQARRMLSMLPQSFVWTKVKDQNGRTVLHFAPNPRFHPPSYQARVFAAMEGEMVVDDAQHRIASIRGRMIHDVKFGYGLLGEIRAGGTFNVERRELKPGIWEITETHVHMEGRALLFKTISDQEDEVKSNFRRLAGDLSLAGAEQLLMKQHG